jgi:hypothetical protein
LIFKMGSITNPSLHWLYLFLFLYCLLMTDYNFLTPANNLDCRLHFLELNKVYEPFTLTERLNLETN